MRLEHEFTVPVPVDEAWRVLLDLPTVAPCMPGATLTSAEGDEFTGTVKVKLGPIGLTYQGKGRFVERDEAAHRVVIEASGKDTRAAGTAKATVTATLTDRGAETAVAVATDLTVTGKPAQFGRGMISDVSGKLIGQFADCLAGELAAGPPAAAEPVNVAEPVTATGAASSGGSVSAADVMVAQAGDTPARTAEPAATAAATRSAPATVTAPRPARASDADTEPVDLLALAGSSAAMRRAAGFGLGALILLVIVWVVVRRRH